jgi:hypothetical protein
VDRQSFRSFVLRAKLDLNHSHLRSSQRTKEEFDFFLQSRLLVDEEIQYLINEPSMHELFLSYVRNLKSQKALGVQKSPVRASCASEKFSLANSEYMLRRLPEDTLVMARAFTSCQFSYPAEFEFRLALEIQKCLNKFKYVDDSNFEVINALLELLLKVVFDCPSKIQKYLIPYRSIDIFRRFTNPLFKQTMDKAYCLILIQLRYLSKRTKNSLMKVISEYYLDSFEYNIEDALLTTDYTASKSEDNSVVIVHQSKYSPAGSTILDEYKFEKKSIIEKSEATDELCFPAQDDSFYSKITQLLDI